MLKPEQQSSIGTAIFLFALIGIAFFGAYSGSSRVQPTNQGCAAAHTHGSPAVNGEQTKPDDNNQPTGFGSSALNQTESENQQRASTDCSSNADENRQMIESTARIAQGTFWLAIFTAFLGVAAMWTAIIARDTARHQLRAQVQIERIDLDLASSITPMVVNGIFQNSFAVTVKNYGPTLATDVVFIGTIVGMQGFARNLSPGYDFNQFKDMETIQRTEAAGGFISRFSLPPGQSEISRMVISNPATLDRIHGTINRTDSTCVLGHIYYKDIYGRNWRTKFCRMWEPWHPSGPRFVPSNRYNDEDQEALEDQI